MSAKDWPKYQSHKIVQALPLVGISHAEDAPEAALRFEDGSDLIVSDDWLKKHNPQVGGYVVRYEDGYLSWSPKDVFESGYSLFIAQRPDAILDSDGGTATGAPVAAPSPYGDVHAPFASES